MESIESPSGDSSDMIWSWARGEGCKNYKKYKNFGLSILFILFKRPVLTYLNETSSFFPKRDQYWGSRNCCSWCR